MMNIEKYVLENVLGPILKVDGNKRYVLEEDYDKLNLNPNEVNFVREVMRKNSITVRFDLIEKEDRSSLVRDFVYGQRETEGTIDRDVPVYSEIKHDENGNLVFENYEQLDEFIENEFLPENVTMKKKRKSEDFEGNLYPFVQLNSIVKLKLSELEFKHVMEYLKENNILVRGIDNTIDGEFENYDYWRTFKTTILPDSLSQEELNGKLELYSVTRDPVIREQIILGCMRMVPYAAYKIQRKYKYDMGELESYGYEGLIMAVDGYNPKLDKKFSSYAFKCINGQILSGLANIEGFGRNPLFGDFLKIKTDFERKTGVLLTEDISLLDEILKYMVENGYVSEKNKLKFRNYVISYYDNPNMEEYSNEGENEFDKVIANVDLGPSIKNALDTLTPREKEVIMYRFGLYDGKTYNLEETAKKIGGNISRDRIRQIEAKALRKMRHPARLGRMAIREFIYSDMPSDISYDEPKRR